MPRPPFPKIRVWWRGKVLKGVFSCTG